MNISMKHHWGKWMLIAVTAITWMTATDTQAQSNRKSVGEVAVPFALTNIRTGEPFDLSEAEGSIILLDFFFYW